MAKGSGGGGRSSAGNAGSSMSGVIKSYNSINRTALSDYSDENLSGRADNFVRWALGAGAQISRGAVSKEPEFLNKVFNEFGNLKQDSWKRIEGWAKERGF